jgi:hypothetical protein
MKKIQNSPELATTLIIIAILLGILCCLPLYWQISIGIGIGILGFVISIINLFN